jgi:hypothetical protein
MGEKCTQNLVEKPERKRSLGRCWHIQEDNIRMDLRETGYKGMDWMFLAQDRDQWWPLVCEHSNVSVSSIKGGEFTE